MDKNDNDSKVGNHIIKTLGTVIASTTGVIILSIVLMRWLYYSHRLEWNEIMPLADALAGGAIGCIGTLIAVILTVHQTDKMYDRNKHNERMKLAYENMPIFLIGNYPHEPVLISPFKLGDQDKIKLRFVIRNISDKYVYLDGYIITAYYSKESILAIKEDEEIDCYTINKESRSKSKVKIGRKEYEYKLDIISPKEDKIIMVDLNVDKNMIDAEGDIYIQVNLKYRNMINQDFEQELLVIQNYKNTIRNVFYKGEEMPTVIKY